MPPIANPALRAHPCRENDSIINLEYLIKTDCSSKRKTMEYQTQIEWTLPSGSWSSSADSLGFDLKASALGNPVSPLLNSQDVGSLMLVGCSHADVSHTFPPEFKFSPVSGDLLHPVIAARPDISAWVPPFGGLPVTDMANVGLACGLRQTSHPLVLPVQGSRRTEQHDPDIWMDTPPPGSYQFFSAMFGTMAPALIALNPATGALFAWLPASGKWQPLKSSDKHFLAESELASNAWRPEVLSGFNSKIYLPTQHGMACVTPDVPSLRYQTIYIGQTPAIGAPILFDGKIWLPLKNSDHIEFINVDAQNKDGESVVLNCPIDLGEAGAPVSYGRVAIWPFRNGQVLLKKNADGSVAAFYWRWPARVTARFEFGSAFLSRSGLLWQLCFDDEKDNYVYMQLGAQVDGQPTFAPRFCSGTLNYYFTTKLKNDPWLEPPDGHGVGSNEFVIPLLESTARASVVGLRLTSSAGLADFLRSKESIIANLVLDDESRETFFHLFSVTEPWLLQLFVHGEVLWAYHPALNRIAGWNLQA